jgi:hypothetical protein
MAKKRTSNKKNQDVIHHVAKPYIRELVRLCRDPRFKQRAADLRVKWKITELLPDFDSFSNSFWKPLCEKDAEHPDYIEKYEGKQCLHQMFAIDVENLYQDLLGEFALPGGSEACTSSVGVHEVGILASVMTIVSCVDLDDVTEETLKPLGIGMPWRASRIDLILGGEPAQEWHLYLDVTWAGKEDLDWIWKVVQHWQKSTRPLYIRRRQLPDLLKDIKPGRPVRDDDIAIRCARWKQQRKTYKEIKALVEAEYSLDWALAEDSYGNLSTCPTAVNYVKRGRELLE